MRNSTPYKDTSALLDNMIRIFAGGTFIGIAFVAPQMLQLLDKPTNKLLDNLDERERIRKIKEGIRYMRQQGLLVGDYDHGIRITPKAQKRIDKADFNNLSIPIPKEWDGCWRIIFFDIPEQSRDKRASFTGKIRGLGFQPLQQSVWIHPFSSKEIIARICKEYRVSQWVTYIEVSEIDNQQKLVKRFNHIIKT